MSNSDLQDAPMQKLATIFLTSEAYTEGRFFGPGSQAHGHVEEHLARELAEGWKVVSITACGGLNEFGMAKAWVAVVLEKPDE
jgi:hypothetical protein